MAINYRSRDAQAQKALADITAKDGQAIAVPGDMAGEADIVRCSRKTEKASGPVTHLVNSAGAARPRAGRRVRCRRPLRLFAVNMMA